ncbi:MAG: sensor histidine kinase [Aestuariibaculum sp.]
MELLFSIIQESKTFSSAPERYLLLYMVVVLFVVTALVVAFFVVFLKRKNKLLIDKIEQKQAFDAEITQAQTETQEQTLKNISWELHDNVGQLLSFANMQLSILKMQMPGDEQTKFKDVDEALKKSLTEVRQLSKTLNREVLLNTGLETAVTNELNRLNKMVLLSAKLHIEGDKLDFTNKKHEIIIFRIIQEFMSNSVKYSKAKHLDVILHYQDKHLTITLKDDGIGFDMAKTEKGSGLINMKSRAKLINATINLESKPNKGVQLILVYPLHNFDYD